MSTIGHEFWKKTKYQYLEPPNREGKKKPPLELEYTIENKLIDLPKPEDIEVVHFDLREAIEKRTSIRKYQEGPITLAELSYLLWATQGVKEVVPAVTTFRTVPSAGARHAFETYLLVNRVEGLQPGIYRFLALKHSLLPIKEGPGIAQDITEACLKQGFILDSAVTFFWVAVSERMNFKYGERGYRYLLLDAGHVCQNLYLSALSLHFGVCAIAAFDDDQLNSLLELDGTKTFVIYAATVGRKR